IRRTADLMVEWLRVGFVHGVMNTDNMSILGLTIDYGPYSFVDDYDPNFTPNTTDLPGRRYAFGRQASVAKWNLGCLGGALAPLFPDTDELVAALNTYDDYFWNSFYKMMANKTGLDELRPEDTTLLAEFEKTMRLLKPDMTIFYQLLIDLPVEINTEKEVVEHFKDSFYKDEFEQNERESLFNLIKNYAARIKTNTISREESLQKMKENNPRFILRNYLLHQAIQDLEKGNDTLFSKLQTAMKDPYSNKHDEFFVKRPGWATQKAGCSMLSCSS
ncbi:MAG TPA: protein adenylyltransferase SelO family protein, partial [Segetibacter sp.]